MPNRVKKIYGIQKLWLVKEGGYSYATLGILLVIDGERQGCNSNSPLLKYFETCLRNPILKVRWPDQSSTFTCVLCSMKTPYDETRGTFFAVVILPKKNTYVHLLTWLWHFTCSDEITRRYIKQNTRTLKHTDITDTKDIAVYSVWSLLQ